MTSILAQQGMKIVCQHILREVCQHILRDMEENSLRKKVNKMPHKSLRERAVKAIERFGPVDIRANIEEVYSMSDCENCGRHNNMDRKLLLNLTRANCCDYCGKNINKGFVFVNPNIEFDDRISVAKNLEELHRFITAKNVKEVNKFLNPNRAEKNK